MVARNEDSAPPSMIVSSLPYFESNPYQKLLSDSLENRNIKTYYFNHNHNLPILNSIYTNPKPHILHLHWLHPFTKRNSWWKQLLISLRFIFELTIVKIIGIQIVWTMHNLYAHDGRFRRTELFFIRWALRYFDKIIVHCHKARKSAVKTYKLIPNKSNKFFVIPHGSYIDVYNNMTSREDARSKLGLDSEHTVLLFLGQLREYKGIDQLIEAFSSIPEKNIRLILAGKCPREDLLYKIQEAKKKDSRILIYPKFIPEDEIQIYMNATDIVVLPFTNVLTSGSMILGMSFGKAIIAPKMGCIPETIANKGGVLYDPDDPNGLKNAIAFIIEKNVGDMGRRNFEVVQNIPWDVVAKKTMLLYKKP